MAVPFFVLGIVALTLVVPVVAILGVVAVLTAIIRTISGSSRRVTARTDTEETRIMQEIHRGLAKMESRMENLEAILDAHEEKAGHAKHGL